MDQDEAKDGVVNMNSSLSEMRLLWHSLLLPLSSLSFTKKNFIKKYSPSGLLPSPLLLPFFF